MEMEGGLVDDHEIERRKSSAGSKRGRDDKEATGRGLEKRPSGVVLMEEYSYSGDEMINGVKYEEEKETPSPTPTPTPGLFNQLITNLVNSPRSNQQEPESLNTGGVVAEDDKGDDGGRGNAKEDDGGEENAKEDDDGGGNVIDNIVSRLPRTLSEDTAPATDEASILIHSIIHD